MVLVGRVVLVARVVAGWEVAGWEVERRVVAGWELLGPAMGAEVGAAVDVDDAAVAMGRVPGAVVAGPVAMVDAVLAPSGPAGAVSGEPGLEASGGATAVAGVLPGAGVLLVASPAGAPVETGPIGPEPSGARAGGSSGLAPNARATARAISTTNRAVIGTRQRWNQLQGSWPGGVGRGGGSTARGAKGSSSSRNAPGCSSAASTLRTVAERPVYRGAMSTSTEGPRRNRVDPWGDLHAETARGLFTGNRGCLVNDGRRLVRHHVGSLWITCVTEYRGRRHELDQPRRWTPLFFLDDAVALAAGHRPCGECRPAAYRAYRDGVAAGLGLPAREVRAGELNRRLAAERLDRGRGLERARHRKLWPAPYRSLPPGTVIASPSGEGPGRARLVVPGGLRPFAFEGWGPIEPPPVTGEVAVLTPPTSVLALTHGFQPVLHPSA